VSMSLRLKALVYCATLKFAKKPLVFLVMVLFCPVFSQSPSSNEDLKKQADKLFQQEDYTRAYKLYSQLVSNFPKDPEYNYKLGVCMIYSEPDKKKSLPYLKFATANSSDNKALKEVRFYLGKAYHINYLFDEAIKNYNEYKLTASSAQIKKMQVDREIKACSNGKHLLSNITDLEVVTKTELSENDYFRSYKKIGGKLLVKPEEFQTSTDKKKKEKSVVFLPTGSDVVYFSSYGDTPDNGKDIYTASKQANGTYGKPQKVPTINTEFDEDYPFLHPDGKTLYFASKGHNSMGGYDIFKSTFNEETATWGPPLNLEFPINSPDDDYLFVTDSLETMAYFSTGRQSPPGKIDVLKVKTKRRPIDIIAMKGNVIPGSPEYSLKSTITVSEVFSQNALGVYNSEEDGSYSMELPNGARLLFIVETPGIETQSVQVSMPMASAAKPYKQTIAYEKGKLKILNYFDEPTNDNTYLQYLKVIEKKAKLEVNDTEATGTLPLAANTTNPEATTTKSVAPEGTKNPEANENETTTTSSVNTVPDPKKGMDNKQLAQLAKQDADELRQEAAQLNRDYEAANETAIKQKDAADKKTAEASDALFKAETLTDESEKRTAVEAANALKLAAESDQALAAKIAQLARSLDDDAKARQKEANLNAEYAKELEKSTKTKDNKASLAKLEDLQKKLSDLSAKKNNSENLVTEIKSEVEQKEKQLAEAEQSVTTLKTSLNEVNTIITEKETELSKTKKKTIKKELTSEIDDLKLERDEKTKQLSTKEVEIKTLTDELATSKSQLELASKITAENIDVATAAKANLPATNKSLQEKYKDKIVISDPESRSSVEESTVQLTMYNKDLDQLISKSKADLPKTKNKDAKFKLTNDIKQAEDVKKQNQAQIVTNNKALNALNSTVTKAPEAVKTTFDPITAQNSTEAVTKLETLNTQLNVNDNENFDYNGYQNPQAQNLKVEADARINDAMARQKKLKDEIVVSKQYLQMGSGVTPQQLNTEAEDFLSQSQKARNDSKTAKGVQKTKLLEDAKKLEDQSNEKYIEAAELTRGDNSSIVAVNQENIQNLINEGKSSEEEVNQAKTLNEEAKVAFRKAADIRVEGNSLSNAGGKLGSFSNAEEKEAEAIMKQQQAIAILVKSNADLKLKTPATSTSAPTVSGSEDLGTKLQTVNTGISELAAIKIESYQKLNEANEAEIAQLLNDVKNNQLAVDNTPSLKTEFISANNKLDNAKTLKQNVENTSNPNEKLSGLIASIKKQNEVIKQLSKLTANTPKPIVTQPAETTNLPVVENPVVVVVVQPEIIKIAEENPLLNENPLLEDDPDKVAPVKENTTVTPADPDDELGLLSQINVQKVGVAQLAQKDTTTDQVINYLENTKLSMRNQQANATAKKSLNTLKDLEAENSTVEQSLKKVNNASESAQPQLSVEELNNKSDALEAEGETLTNKALEFKKDAQTKEGEEKNYSLAQAREVEIQGQDKLTEASDYRQQANENEYKTNINSINELISRLKTDNPTMAEDMEAKREEYTPLKAQVANLRAEANALNSKAAKIGAISNAEEKEQELINKQNQLLAELKKQYPDFVATPVVAKSPEQQVTELNEKKSGVRKKQYAELTNLTNAYSLEYESSKNYVQQNLTVDQQAARQNAEELNIESKRLLIQASQEKEENEKIKLLTLAAKSGNAAVEKLNKLLPKYTAPKSDLEELSTIGTRISSSNEEPVTRTRPPRNTESARAIKIDGLEVVLGNAYSVANPIPMDARMEDGLVFRVQIGAFKTQLPNNAFKGLSPLNGETTGNGYIRYTAGNFFKLENANAVKNDLRTLGYSDAFVVVYFNGKRISLAEALVQLNKEGKTVDPNAPQTAGITSNVNVPKAAVNTAVQEVVEITEELEQIDGLLYTIQIGVYTKQITKPQLLSLRPIFREQLTNGLYRYTAGIYNNPDRILIDKTKVVDMGVKDAFVAAYINGKRVPFAEAQNRQKTETNLKLERENPIIFPNRVIVAPDPVDALLNTPGPVAPFKNSVSNYPAPTPENGVKSNEQGVSFKVQIGAFSKQVPDDVAAQYSAIKSWPIDNKKINGLYIYNIGNFSDAKFAKALKDEAVRLGITDAFVTVYRDGKKVYGPEAENLMR